MARLEGERNVRIGRRRGGWCEKTCERSGTGTGGWLVDVGDIEVVAEGLVARLSFDAD